MSFKRGGAVRAFFGLGDRCSREDKEARSRPPVACRLLNRRGSGLWLLGELDRDDRHLVGGLERERFDASDGGEVGSRELE